MNTIKFATANDLVTEQHNSEIVNMNEHVINGEAYKFYSPCNLNLFVTNTCNNRCSFCINKEKENIDDETYFKNLEEGLEKLKDINLEVTLTGGEPTLFPKKLVETIEILKKFGIHQRTFSTTGYGLLSRYNGKTLLEYLIEADYIHNLNVSRMSIDDSENKTIFNSRKDFTNISNDDLKTIAYISEVNGVQLRTSTNLIPGYVDSLDKILEFVDFQRENRIKSCLFRELEGCELIPL